MSDSLLLDTDVASYLVKNSPRAKPFRSLLKGQRPALAFVSVAELFKWTLKRHWGPEKVNQLEAALRRYVVIPFDRDLAWA
jgi:tRNA(fMet)-specific endonuclease VapC